MATRGVHRGLHSALFDNPDYQWLPAPARLVLLTVRLCKQAGPAAIFRYYPAVISAQTGLPVKQVMAGLAGLAQEGWVEFDETVVWVRNGLRYDPSMRLANPKHREAVLRAIAELPKSRIVVKFCDYYKLPYPFDTHSIASQLKSPPNTEILPEVLPEVLPEDRGTTRIPNLPRAADAAPQAVLDFLNRKTGKAFRAVATNLDLIRARLKDGIEPWQLKAIVSRKTRDWQGTDQAKYLRPATLFNKTKCEQYLGELPRNGDAPHDHDAD